MVLGEMDVALVNPRRFGQGPPIVLGLVPTSPVNGGHPMPGGDSRSASYPADDFHQAWIA